MSCATDYISLDDAKRLIVTALDEFDPKLASRAASILYDNERLNVVEVDEAKEEKMQQCRPAGFTMEDVKSLKMHKPDFAERFGPHFTRQDNPEPHAIVDFEYDGTPHSIVWLAHETGHAVADDIQRENGHSFRDFSTGEMEEQAYFLQHIVSGYLKDNLQRPDVKDADLGQDVLKMSWDRAEQYTNAGKVFESALETPVDVRQKTIMATFDQRLMG